MVKSKFILVSLIFLAVISLNFVSAALLVNFTTSSTYFNRTANTFLNFTINALSHNITSVNISLSYASPVNGSIGTSNLSAISIYGNDGLYQIVLENITARVLFENNTIGSIWFNITSQASGEHPFNFIALSGSWSLYNSSYTKRLVSNFEFSGLVKNDSGDLASGVSVFMYQFIETGSGPPTELAVSSANTSSDGSFTVPSINGSASMYKIKMLQYNATGTAIKIGSNLPPFPAMMFYPSTFHMLPGLKEFMKPPILNGTTFYIQPAATINLYELNRKHFGYMLIDKKVGFPVESNMKNKVQNVNISVPAGRDYTIMILREPMQFVTDTSCLNNFGNSSTCPFPPRSNSTLPTLSEGNVIDVNINLNVTQRRLYGCLSVSGNITTINNSVSIIPKLIPWPGFVPPIKAEIGTINLSSQSEFNYSDPKCSGKWAFYNLSVMDSDYIVEFYARNGSVNQFAQYIGAIQNVSINSSTDIYQNITLAALSGGWPTGIGLGELNVTKMRINLQNSSGAPMTNQMHAELKVKHSVFGTLGYIIDSSQMVNGTFFMPILAGSSWAKLMAFPNEAPPIERTLNLTIAENNITLPSGELGFRKMLNNGTLVQANVSELPIEMRFIRNTASCNVNNPASTCVLTTMNAEDFNPMKAMVAGKVNLEMKLLATNRRDNVTITYWNFDMFSAKPPTNSMLNENASSKSATATTAEQIWQFGSFAPSDAYDNVTIAIPYSAATSDFNYLNDTWSFSMTLPVLYKESSLTQGQLEAVWNRTAGYTAENLTDDFLEYNRSSFRDYLTASGIACSKTDANSICYMDTSARRIYMKIPHFTGVNPRVGGTAPATGAATATAGGGGSTTTTYWTRTYSPSETQLSQGYTQALEVKAKINFKINNTEHLVGVVALTTTTATINVSSQPQQATLTIGKEEKFELTNDNYYDLSVKLNSIANSQASLTIKKLSEKMPETPVTTTPTAEEQEEAAEEIQAKETLKNVQFWVIIAVVIIIIILVILYFASKKKR